MAMAAFPLVRGALWREELGGPMRRPGPWCGARNVAAIGPRRLVVVSARRSRRRIKSKESNYKHRDDSKLEEEDEDDEDDDEKQEGDALEALFAQLEKDMEAVRAGKTPDTVNEEMATFQQELDAALMDEGKQSKQKKRNGAAQPATPSVLQKFIQEAEKIEAERISKRIVRLEKWQLRKLKAALDLRKGQIQVKALAGETGLDRRDVLSFLRNPPAELLQLVDSISDSEEEEEDVVPGVQEPEPEPEPEPQLESKKPAVQRIGTGEDIEQGVGGPQSWYVRKRIRREHLDTFEKVFQRTKRPTGALIQNMVELTHVPRRRILDWFENRRSEHAVRAVERKPVGRKKLKAGGPKTLRDLKD